MSNLRLICGSLICGRLICGRLIGGLEADRNAGRQLQRLERSRLDLAHRPQKIDAGYTVPAGACEVWLNT